MHTMRTMDEFDDDERHPLMAALGQGVPITLLMDLIDPHGPRSAEMYRRERLGGGSLRVDADQAESA
jgi:hypothetical protein